EHDEDADPNDDLEQRETVSVRDPPQPEGLDHAAPIAGRTGAVGPEGDEQRTREAELRRVGPPAAAVVLPDFSLADGRCGGHRTAPPVNRSAASAPESMTVGTPTPGTVVEPASTRFAGNRGDRLRGRNGPVCRNRCANPKGLPSIIPCSAQVSGVSRRPRAQWSAMPARPRDSRTPTTSARWAGPTRSQSTSAEARLGHGASTLTGSHSRPSASTVIRSGQVTAG